MPAIAPVPPIVMRDLLVLAGWAVSAEGRLNWILTKGGNQIVLPKRGKVLSLVVFENILTKADLGPGKYWELLPRTGFNYHVEGPSK